MSTVISRLYNWVTDKSNNVKITASRQDGELDQQIVALNRKVLCSGSAPSSPIAGQTWVDTTNKFLKVYRNNEWVIQGAVHVSATGNVMATPQEGDIWYDTTLNTLQAYNGATWDVIQTSPFTPSVSNALSGSVIQTVNTQSSSYASIGSTAVPNDDTTPTWAEGNEISALQTAITPNNASNKLRITVSALFSTTGSDTTTFLCLFNGPSGTDPAIQVAGGETTNAYVRNITMIYYMAAGTTSEITFKFRAGTADGAATFFNGTSIGTARKFGGVAYSSVTIEEIKA